MIECLAGRRFSGASGANDLLTTQRRTVHACIVPGQSTARDPGLQAAGLAAPALRRVDLFVGRPGKRSVPPLAAYAMGTFDQPALDDDSATTAGTEYCGERDVRADRGAIDEFGERQAVGVVGHAHF